MLAAADTNTDKWALAPVVYEEATDEQLYWLLVFFQSLVYHMADLEDTQGGYRTEVELYLGHWCKTLKGHMMNMEAEDEDNAIY